MTSRCESQSEESGVSETQAIPVAGSMLEDEIDVEEVEDEEVFELELDEEREEFNLDLKAFSFARVCQNQYKTQTIERGEQWR